MTEEGGTTTTDESGAIEVPYYPTFAHYKKYLFTASEFVQFNPRPLSWNTFSEEYNFHAGDKEGRWKYQKEIRWRLVPGEDDQPKVCFSPIQCLLIYTQIYSVNQMHILFSGTMEHLVFSLVQNVLILNWFVSYIHLSLNSSL